ncbi:hypothetical protein ACIBF1_21645 [Spirillospora sp. NPDC050679]
MITALGRTAAVMTLAVTTLTSLAEVSQATTTSATTTQQALQADPPPVISAGDNYEYFAEHGG